MAKLTVSSAIKRFPRENSFLFKVDRCHWRDSRNFPENCSGGFGFWKALTLGAGLWGKGV